MITNECMSGSLYTLFRVGYSIYTISIPGQRINMNQNSIGSLYSHIQFHWNKVCFNIVQLNPSDVAPVDITGFRIVISRKFAFYSLLMNSPLNYKKNYI